MGGIAYWKTTLPKYRPCSFCTYTCSDTRQRRNAQHLNERAAMLADVGDQVLLMILPRSGAYSPLCPDLLVTPC
jgi:hypothetical protein